MTSTTQWHGLADTVPQPRRAAPPTLANDRRATSYSRRLAATDALAIAIASYMAYLVRFPEGGRLIISNEIAPDYLWISAILSVTWFAVLGFGRTRDHRLLGVGNTEFTRVFEVSWHLFAALAVVAYLAKAELGRGYLGIAAPIGIALLLTGRLIWRRQLHRRRERGLDQAPVLVVGPRHKAARLVSEFKRNPRAGYEVVGVCVPSGEFRAGETVSDVPILGTRSDAAEVARRINASAVAVTGSDAMTSEAVKQLGWDLEGSGIDLALTLSLADVAGPRVLVQPANGLPLVYVDEPRFSGSKYVLKNVFDIAVTAILVVVLSPLLALIAALVKLTDRGPVLYSQERIGKDGKPFEILKFRSMVVNAHDQLEDVLASEGVSAVGVFYKPKNDPRVTRLGRVLRRYSLDELPQLFNVLRGEMSLVGPRPQIAAEVATYDRAAHRRLLVKPGLTGLWQISGRSNLDPAIAMRLDVSYVENWTMFGDILILARTAKAMFGADGAY